MKKALVVFLLVILVATGAFAQTAIIGQAQIHSGLNMPFNEPFSMDDANWVANFLHAHTFLQVVRRGENTMGMLRFTANGQWRGFGRVTVADVVDLEIGQIELPWQHLSSNWLFSQHNLGIGSASSTLNPFFLFRTHGFYAGISEAGIFNNATVESRMSPGFFLGYAMPLDMMNLHFAFAGRAAPDVFSFMGTAQARAIDLGPVFLGVNATIYMNPEFGFFLVSAVPGPAPFASLTRRTSDDNIFVLECLVDIRLPLNFGAASLTLGGVTNFAADHDGFGLQVGLAMNIPLAGSFSIMPGLQYQTIINSDARDTLLIGATLRYSF